MEIRVQIIKVFPVASGTSASGFQWSNQKFIGQTYDTYPRTIEFTIRPNKDGEWTVQAPAEGDDVNISFDIDSRESNGRYFTNIYAWKVEPGTSVTDQQPYMAAPTAPAVQQPYTAAPIAPTAPAPQQPYMAAPQPSPIDDMPF